MSARLLDQLKRAKSNLAADSYQTSKDLARIINEYPSFKIRPEESSTISRIQNENNQQLSDHRPRSVQSYFLAQNGIDSQ